MAPSSSEAALQLHAQLIRDLARLHGSPVWPKGKELSIRILLKAGLLAGQAVQYRHRRGYATLNGDPRLLSSIGGPNAHPAFILCLLFHPMPF